MFATVSCFRYTKPLVRAAQYTCRGTVGKTGSVSFNTSQIRAFRFSPLNPASVRSRFGKGTQKTRVDSTTPAVGKFACLMPFREEICIRQILT